MNDKPYTINPALAKSCENYLQTMIENHSKIFPIRFDLHYKSDVKEKLFAQYPLIIKAHHDVALLLTLLRLNPKNHLIGMISAFEEASNERIHIHCVLFVNGQYHQRSFGFMNQIEAIWKEKISSASHVYDCNREADKRYKFNALTKIDYFDEGQQDNLRMMLDYFAKNETKESFCRFNKLFLSALKPKDKRGAKRKHQRL